MLSRERDCREVAHKALSRKSDLAASISFKKIPLEQCSKVLSKVRKLPLSSQVLTARRYAHGYVVIFLITLREYSELAVQIQSYKVSVMSVLVYTF